MDDCSCSNKFICREVERYRRFGELCNIAQKDGYAEYGFVFALLQEIGSVLELRGDIQDQKWFQTVSSCILLVPSQLKCNFNSIRDHPIP